jgi:purine-binding chemotaxis protein CheW
MSAINQQRNGNEVEVRLAAVFRQRAEQLAQRGRQEAGRFTAVPILVLRIGDERFGIELDYVKQVFPPAQLTPVAGAPAAMLGVSNLNGTPRSVFDLGRLLNLPASVCESPYLVLLRIRGKLLGLAVEAVEQVRLIELDNLLSIDQLAGDSANECVKGTTDDHIAVLDTTTLLQLAVRKPDAQAREQSALAGASR